MDEKGIIKFRCNWEKAEPLPEECIADINRWRDILYKKNLIGIDASGIGYGNISKRYNDNQFVVSGSATGNLALLSNEHYTVVTNFNIHQNLVNAKGPIIASSESLTHAALYQCDSSINAVIHIHSNALWKHLMRKVPTSNKSAEYGTPAMAKEIVRLYNNTNVRNTRILVMAGHEDGVMSFGPDIDAAGNVILNWLDSIDK